MKQLSKYQLKKVSGNLDYYFNKASEKDIEEGKKWYYNANQLCKNIASRFNSDTETVAQVISALSPRNKWDKNIIDTVTVFDAVKKDLDPSEIKVCTYHRNKSKAFDIVSKTVNITNNSRKTFSFVKNIGNLDSNYVTIDVWHLRACMMRDIKTTPTKKAYDQLQKLTLLKASKHNLKGFEYQSIIWNVIRNKKIYETV